MREPVTTISPAALGWLAASCVEGDAAGGTASCAAAALPMINASNPAPVRSPDL
jgi:hypothetical protein